MKKSIAFAALLLMVCNLSYGAALRALDKKEITFILTDKTITTIPLVTYNGQLENNTLIAYLDKQGQISGKLANKPDNDLQNDTGTWMVQPDGTLCITWQHWNTNKPVCLSVYQLDNGLAFVNHDNQSFETFVLEENIEPTNLVR